MVGCALTAMTLLLLAGHGPWSGHVLVELTNRHGLNYGDLPILALWVIGLICCVALWRRRGA